MTLRSSIAAVLLAGAAPLGAQPAHEHAESAAGSAPADHEASHLMLEDPWNRLVRVNELEARDGGAAWDLDAWMGRDTNKLWLRSEGERDGSTTHAAELEVLWAHAFARWWEFVAGARHDFRPDPDLASAAFGVQGIAPYRVEIEATAYAADGGRAAARVEARYEVLVTNRWILQPSLKMSWNAQSDPERGQGSGLAAAEAGLRLRYEVRRELAPYVGLVRHEQFGSTADFARAQGRDAGDTTLVAGIRIWF